jgi:hypothetical protein
MYVYNTHLAPNLGQLDIGGDLSSLFGATDDNTGLPYVLEFGLGILAVVLLSRAVGGAKSSYRKSRKKRATTAARRAALKAQLAAL